jgi:N-acetylglucosamine-6-sulfatase
MFDSLSILLASLALVSPGLAQGEKHNIVMIMTDDQDKQLGSTDYMDTLHQEIFDQGAQFNKHYVTTAQCCPSRASLLRGQLAHNTNVTHVLNPGYVCVWFSSIASSDSLLVVTTPSSC